MSRKPKRNPIHTLLGLTLIVLAVLNPTIVEAVTEATISVGLAIVKGVLDAIAANLTAAPPPGASISLSRSAEVTMRCSIRYATGFVR